MRITLVSDTHGFLDEKILKYCADADEIWHAGDIGTVSVIDQLNAIKPTRFVYGNIDGAEIRSFIPEIQHFELGGLRFFMVHIAGKANLYLPTLRPILRKHKPDVFICGHSHIPVAQRCKDFNGMLHLNPGAAGVHGFHKVRTLMRFQILEGKIQHLELIELGQRGALV